MDKSSRKRTLSTSSDKESAYEEKCFIIIHNNQAQCLICGAYMISKKYNIERHYNSQHGTTYDKVEGSERVKLLEDLKSAINEVNFFYLYYTIYYHTN